MFEDELFGAGLNEDLDRENAEREHVELADHRYPGGKIQRADDQPHRSGQSRLRRRRHTGVAEQAVGELTLGGDLPDQRADVPDRQLHLVRLKATPFLTAGRLSLNLRTVLATASLTTPRTTFGLGRHLALASFWFGLNYHWIPILVILIPGRVATLLPNQQGLGIGVITGVGAIFAMVLPPLVGYWSDRLVTPYGRRRPIMVVGIAGNVVGLLILLFAPNFTMLVAGYVVVQIFNNSAGAAFNAVVPDVVPKEEFGKASGLLGAMVQVGSVAGLATVILADKVLHNTQLTYAFIAVVIVVTLLPTLWASRGEGMVPVPREAPLPPREAIARFLEPLRRGDFAWVVYTRTFITAGIYCVLPFLLLFFKNVVMVRDPESFTAFWQLALLLAATPFGLAGGWISDRLGRKIFVYLSGAAQSLVLLVFIVLFPHDQNFVLVLGIFYGIGYGLYYAVDWALAVDTLPDRDHSAKDMGLFHVAFTLPQVLLPAVAGPLLDLFNHQSPNSGYRVIFSASIVFYVVGTLLVSRIKSVR